MTDPPNEGTMRWYHYVSYFFGGAFLANTLPHLSNGISGSPPKYKYVNHGVQSINALRNLNALIEEISSSISASTTLVLGSKIHCDRCSVEKY